MKLNIKRILLTAVLIEIVAVLLLVLLVALAGPSDPDGAQAFAQRTGSWFGPIAGFTLCLIGGWYVARRITSVQVLSGIVLGLAVAIIDGGLLVASESEFKMIFVLSNVAKILSGGLGGWFAGRSAART